MQEVFHPHLDMFAFAREYALLIIASIVLARVGTAVAGTYHDDDIGAYQVSHWIYLSHINYPEACQWPSFPLLGSDRTNAFYQVTDHEFARVSLVHSGNSTVKLKTSAASWFLRQLNLSRQVSVRCSYIAEGLFHQFKDNFSANPSSKLILSAAAKARKQSSDQQQSASRVPGLVFNSIFTDHHGKQRVNETGLSGTEFSQSRSELVEPLFFVIELREMFTDSLLTFLNQDNRTRQKYTFTAAGYVALILGYVHDFRACIDAGVIPSDAHPGNLLFNLEPYYGARGQVNFFWAEYGPVSIRSMTLDKETLWQFAMTHFNALFEMLNAHLGRVGLFPSSILVHELLAIVSHHTKVLALLQEPTGTGMHSHAGSVLRALETSLFERFQSWPAKSEVQLQWYLHDCFERNARARARAENLTEMHGLVVRQDLEVATRSLNELEGSMNAQRRDHDHDKLVMNLGQDILGLKMDVLELKMMLLRNSLLIVDLQQALARALHVHVNTSSPKRLAIVFE